MRYVVIQVRLPPSYRHSETSSSERESRRAAGAGSTDGVGKLHVPITVVLHHPHYHYSLLYDVETMRVESVY
jgi:hypothetical protein